MKIIGILNYVLGRARKQLHTTIIELHYYISLLIFKNTHLIRHANVTNPNYLESYADIRHIGLARNDQIAQEHYLRLIIHSTPLKFQSSLLGCSGLEDVVHKSTKFRNAGYSRWSLIELCEG